MTPTRELALQIHADIRDLGCRHPDSQRDHLWRRQRRAADRGPAAPGGYPGGLPGRLLDLMGRATPAWTRSKCWCWTKPTACSTWASCRMCAASSRPHLPAARRCCFRPPSPRSGAAGRAELAPPAPHRYWPAAPGADRFPCAVPVPPHLKSPLLLELLAETSTDSVLIFTRTKHRARKVARQMRAGRLPCHQPARQPLPEPAPVRPAGFQAGPIPDHGGDRHRRAGPGHRVRSRT